jgi:2-polyprenyl-3-methyl-5-hydroxy-6-metoxy-1,4-benzoquinol methylase
MRILSADALVESVVDGCAAERDWYEGYLRFNAVRILGDVDFVSRTVTSENSVLDIGGVPPLFLAGLKESGFERLSLIDPHPEPFAAYFAKSDIHAIKGNVLSGDIAGHGRVYDLVCLNEVVEHLAGNLIDALSRSVCLVRPGGLLLVTTPNLRSFWGLYALMRRSSGLASKPGHSVREQYDRASAAHGYFGHVREYTPREIKTLMASLGCVLVDECYQSNYINFGRPTKAIGLLERFVPRWRLFAKYLFKRIE